jgi:ferredoxin/flavodoxin---NADP+ reductase
VTERFSTRVVSCRQLSPSGYELRLERGNLEFRAGQLITIHGDNVLADRSYTIASGEKDDFIDVLFRYIPSGTLTPKLAGLSVGDTMGISGPLGEFTLRDRKRPLVFVGTGTGVAPCRSFIRTHHRLHITILHGVRMAEDLFYRTEFEAFAYHPCVSSGGGNAFHGRVTAFAQDMTFDPRTHFYLCGANEMFYDMRDLLLEKGFSLECIFTEAYYYRADD